MPRISRKTALALAVSASLVIGAGGMATAAVLKLPAFGFGSAAGARRVVTRGTIPRIVYHDHYVTTPAVQEQPATSSAGSGITPAPAPAPAPLPEPSPSRQARALPVAAAPVPPAPDPPTTQAPPTARPGAPANCREPEWDQEHLVWHCSNGDD
jgi:hypothetical protein